MTQAVSRLRQLDYKQGVIYFGFLGIFLFFALTLHDVGHGELEPVRGELIDREGQGLHR